MKRLAIALLALGACDDDEQEIEGSPDASIDAGEDGSLDAGQLPPALAGSYAAWERLVAANPGPYWYEEENCRVNSATGGTTFVQVEQGAARAVGYTYYARSQCRARVNRYGTLVGDGTMRGLHEACAALLARRADTSFRIDGQGVVAECWVGTAPNCKDNCGEGFYLVSRGFGIANVPDAGAYDGGF